MASPHILIVGAGPAGIRAAEVVVAAGLRPTIVDEAPLSGGQIYRRPPPQLSRPARKLYGSEAGKATALHRTFDALRGRLDHRPDSLAWNLRAGVLHVLSGEVSEALPFDGLIIAAGATDRVFPLPGWTLPGVYTLGGAQIALKAQACAIGSQVVFLGTGPLLYLVAWQYLQAGAKVAAVLDTSALATQARGLVGMAARPGVLLRGLAYAAGLRARGVMVRSGVTPLAFEGDEAGVRAVRFADAAGRQESIACDAAGFGFHLRAETQLADLAGCAFAFEPPLRQWLPQVDAMGRSSVPGIYLAGDGVLLAGADAAECSGALAAHAALRDLGLAVDEAAVRRLLDRHGRLLRFRDGVFKGFPWPGERLAGTLAAETLVCRCEAITAGALRQAVTEKGAPEVNRAKAFSRVGMGRCQGRFCGLASAEIVAQALGAPIEAVGRLRGQAPVKPLPARVRVRS